MAVSILDYNRALSSGNAQQYNNVLQQFQNIQGNTANPAAYMIPTGTTTRTPAASVPSANTPAQSNPQPQPSIPSISDADLNAVYQPGMTALQRQEDLLTNTLYPNELQRIQNQGTSAKGNLDTSLGQYENQLTSDQNTLGDQRQSALAQAAKDYASLMQRYGAYFGGSSSAAGAATEIAGQQLLQTRGNIQQSYQKSLGDLLTQHAQYLLWDKTQRANIDTALLDEESKARDNYFSQLQDIKNNRYMLESQKSAKKLELLQQAVNRIQAIQDYKLQKQVELDSVKQQWDYQLQTQAQSIAQQHAAYLSSNPFQNTNQMDMSQPTSSQTQYAPSYLANGKKTDWLGNVIA